MFERFTERARQVITLAQQHAREFESEEIGVEHLLLACYTEEKGAAARVLRHLNVNEALLRDLIEFGSAGKKNRQQTPFTKQAKNVFELALREALNLGHNYIGSEHLLLGIIRDQPAIVREVVDPQLLRDKMLRFLSGPKKDTRSSTIVNIEIKQEQIWINAQGISWYVDYIDGNTVYLRRHGMAVVAAHDLVCKWRQPKD